MIFTQTFVLTGNPKKFQESWKTQRIIHQIFFLATETNQNPRAVQSCSTSGLYLK